MERILGGRGFEIVYEPGDSVKIIDGNDRIPCIVISDLKSDMVPDTFPVQWVQGYWVELEKGERLFVPRKAIWKEADTGESMTEGKIEHLIPDEFKTSGTDFTFTDVQIDATRKE